MTEQNKDYTYAGLSQDKEYIFTDQLFYFEESQWGLLYTK